MLNIPRYKTSVLFRTHTLLPKVLRVNLVDCSSVKLNIILDCIIVDNLIIIFPLFQTLFYIMFFFSLNICIS